MLTIKNLAILLVTVWTRLLHASANVEEDLWLPMDDLTRLPEDLTLQKIGSPQVMKGLQNTAVVLTGNSRKGLVIQSIGNHPCFQKLLDCPNGYTIEFWIMINAIVETDGGEILSQGPLTVQYLDEKLKVSFGDKSISTDFPLSKWKHVMINRLKTELNLFIDGEYVAQSDISEAQIQPADNSHLQLGGFASNSNIQFLIDNYRFSPAARSSSDEVIKSLQLPNVENKDQKSILKSLNVKYFGDGPELSPNNRATSFEFTDDSSPLRLPSLSPWCLDQIGSCSKGVYITFWIHLAPQSTKQIILQSKFLSIYFTNGTLLTAILTDTIQQMKIEFDMQETIKKWNLIEITWKPNSPAYLFVNKQAVAKNKLRNSLSTVAATRGPTSIGSSENVKTSFKISHLKLVSADRDTLIALGVLESDLAEVLTANFDNDSKAFSPVTKLPVTLYGDARIVTNGYHKNALLISRNRGSYASLGDVFGCLGYLDLCSEGFMLRFWLKPLDNTTDSVILSTRTYKVIKRRDTLSAEMIIDGHLLQTKMLHKLETNKWQLIEITWEPKKGLGLYVNADKIDVVKSYNSIGSTPISKDLRLLIGRDVGAQSLYGPANVEVDDIQLWNTHRDIVYSLGLWNGEEVSRSRKVPKQAPGSVADLLHSSFEKRVNQGAASDASPVLVEYLRFNGSNYIEYNFQRKVASISETEELSVTFSMDPGGNDGLLWYCSDGNRTSFINLREAKVYYVYGIKDTLSSDTSGHMTKEEIYLDLTIRQRDRYTLMIRREGKKILMKINDATHTDDSMYVIPILVPNAVCYLGGSPTPLKDTNGAVSKRFKGSIYYMVVKGNRHPPFDTKNLITDPRWTGFYINRNGVDISKGDKLIGDENNIKLIYEPLAITFLSRKSFLRLNTWDFSKHHTLEIQFSTFEPNGIMFFVGPADRHKDFVCLEMFDGNIYFVYGLDNSYEHVQLNAKGSQVNDGRQYTVSFGRNYNHRFNVTFNGRVIGLNQKSGVEQKVFQTYTYIGNVDSVDRLPWQVWARTGFAGCMYYLKVNGNHYIDPRGTQNQHSTELRGFVFDRCITPPRMCTSSTCLGGQCYDRFEPEPKNFDCDCSTTAKTYRQGVDLPRSEKCSANAEVLTFDGDNLFVVDFLSQSYKLVTHTDDISLSFKTSNPNGILFQTYLENRYTPLDMFFSVQLSNGRIIVDTNINQPGGPSKIYALGGNPLNDDTWNTLYIRRRADYIEMFVIRDEGTKLVATIPIIQDTFDMSAHKIYVGAKDGKNSANRFVGQMRNFYWNQYDFFHTRKRDGTYELNPMGPPAPPKIILPPLPPSYTVTLLNTHKHTTYTQIIPSAKLNTFHLSFKTKYDGVLFQIFESNPAENPFISAILLKGQIYVVWELSNRRGAEKIMTRGSVSDNRWHRIVVKMNPIRGTLDFSVDNNYQFSVSPPRTYSLDNIRLRVGGLPDSVWKNIYSLLRVKYSSDINYLLSNQPYFDGCMGHLFFNDFQISSDIFYKQNQLFTEPRETLRTGICLDVLRCSLDYCKGRGTCQQNSNGYSLTCRCSPGFEGDRCERQITCPPNFCNRGRCYMSSGQPVCDCRGTGYSGSRCEVSICTGYCSNGGRCQLQGNLASCDCTGTGYTGSRCTDIVCRTDYCLNGGLCEVRGLYPYCNCPPGYTGPRCTTKVSPCSSTNNPCQNGGRCRETLDGNGRMVVPICDCFNTNYRGPNCTEPICRPGYCRNGAKCVVRQGMPECDCRGTGFSGSRCEDAECPPNYCLNNGLCAIYNRQPTCSCPSGYSGSRCQTRNCPPNYCLNGGNCQATSGGGYLCQCPSGYRGERCQDVPKCPEDYCYHGGRCYMMNNQPVCDCPRDYKGSRCQSLLKCPPGFCKNGGQCSIVNNQPRCSCASGFTGVDCSTKVTCPADYCQHGGVCYTANSGSFYCDCRLTGYRGTRCNEKTKGFEVEFNRNGYVIYPLPNEPVNQDEVTLTFQTWANTGTLYTFVTRDGKYWALKMLDGKLYVDINGNQKYIQPGYVNDGKPRVVFVYRKGDRGYIRVGQSRDTINFDGILMNDQGHINYKHIIFAADENEQNIFPGILGGFDYNGKLLLDDVYDKKVKPEGSIKIIFTPKIPYPKPDIPDAKCPPNHCVRGTCLVKDNKLMCDCWNTGYFGERCQEMPWGVLSNNRENGGGYIIYDIPNPKPTDIDQFRVMFQTFKDSGTIARFIARENNKYYEIHMKDGKLYLSIGGQNYPIFGENSMMKLNDGGAHLLTMRRDGQNFRFTLDGQKGNDLNIRSFFLNGKLTHERIVLGADKNFNELFEGAIGGFDWNGYQIIDNFGAYTRGTNQHKNLLIVRMPVVLDKYISTKPIPKKPLPDVLPESGAHGGAVWNPLLKIDGGEGGPSIFVKGIGGGGGAIVVAGKGPSIVSGRFGFLTGAFIEPWIAGLLLALLLLLSALIWACYRCKPGCCACCRGILGPGMWAKSSKEGAGLLTTGAAGGHVDNGMILTTTDYTDSRLFNMNRHSSLHSLPGTGARYNVSKSTRSVTGVSPYGQNRTLDISSRFDASTMRIDQPVIDEHRQNVYLSEEMKVDCCVISYNSKYAVTGSSSGAPQVWDMVSGDLYKVMEGMEFGCSDLHLACGDSILVGQVLDDISTMTETSEGKHLKRLQLWDFVTGTQMEMPGEIMSTATCITNDNEHVIVARYGTNFHPSILLWNLMGNQPAKEIHYQSLNPGVRDTVHFLKVTPDDRFVVAGVTSGGMSDQGMSNYMVFDMMTTPHGTSVQPLVTTFNSRLEAIEIINNDEAVVGTRKGELLVWNLHTGKPVRQMTIHATLERNQTATLTPHTGEVNALALSRDGQYLATGGQDQLVKVWQMQDERLMHTLEGHNDDVMGVAISLDNEVVISGSWDGSIRVWRMRDGTQMCWFTSNIEILQVKISNDKRAIVALGERSGHRKLIMLQIVRNRTRRTRQRSANVPGSAPPPYSNSTMQL